MNLEGASFEAGLWVAAVGIYLPLLLMVIGSLANLSAPAGLSTKTPATVAFICSGLQLLLALGLMVPFLNILFAFVLLIPMALFHCNFIIFLKRIAVAAGREDLANSAGRLLVGFVLVPVALWAVVAVMQSLIPNIPLRIVLTTGAIVAVLMLGRYTLLIASVLGAIKPIGQVRSHGSRNLSVSS